MYIHRTTLDIYNSICICIYIYTYIHPYIYIYIFSQHPIHEFKLLRKLKVHIKSDPCRNQTLSPSLCPLSISMDIASLTSDAKPNIVIDMVCHREKPKVIPMHSYAHFFCTGVGHRDWGLNGQNLPQDGAHHVMGERISAVIQRTAWAIG